MSGVAVAVIKHTRGETVSFGLRSDPAYDGTETVTCDIKIAYNGWKVPPDSDAAVATITPVFVPAVGEVAAHWLFTMTAAQTAALDAADYITDAKIVYTDGSVDYPEPLGIQLAGRVTA